MKIVRITTECLTRVVGISVHEKMARRACTITKPQRFADPGTQVLCQPSGYGAGNKREKTPQTYVVPQQAECHQGLYLHQSSGQSLSFVGGTRAIPYKNSEFLYALVSFMSEFQTPV